MRRIVVALLLLGVGSPSARADWEVKRSPFDARVVARYKQLLHANPDDAEALAKLTALYKQRKSVDTLVRELEAAANKSNDAGDFIAVGNLARNRGDFAAAAQAYGAALERAPDDVRALAALADTDVRLGKSGAARPLYERALARTRDPKRQLPLVKKLADLALAPDRGLGAKEAIAEARKYYDRATAARFAQRGHQAAVGGGARLARSARRSRGRVARHRRAPGSRSGAPGPGLAARR